MDEKLNLCNCGCGRIVKRPTHKYIKGHAGKTNVQGRNDKLDAICAYCGKAIKVERWRMEKFGTNNVYCCRKHANGQRSVAALAMLTCENCGKQFEIKRSRKQGNHIFCSVSCATKYLRKIDFPPSMVSCDNCNKVFRVSPSKLKKNKHFYCSLECRAHHIRGENNPSFRSGTGRNLYYGGNWRRQRRMAIQRDSATCQHCGKKPKKTRYLEVHHIQPAYLFNGNVEEANQLSNLICLCSSCHKKAEKGKIAIQPKLI